jgi:hypothetical protein
MDQTVKIYASDGGHSAKTWSRIITNRIIETAPEAHPDIIAKYQKEKHRIEALIASQIPVIVREAIEKHTKEDK